MSKTNFNKLDGENERQYIWRTSKAVDNGEMTWQEFADKVNEVWRNDESEYRNESAYRKPVQQARAYYEDVFSKMVSREYSDEIGDIKREIEREKIKLRDERNAWQKQNRLDARMEQKLDYLEEVIKKSGEVKFKGFKPYVSNSEESMVVCLSDLHIGATGDDIWGEYNSDIAKERLEEYLAQILRIGTRHQIDHVIVLGIGDLISGNIHRGIQVTNRENVIEQIIMTSEYIANFLGELCKCFEVKFINVSGNHSRLCDKDDALKDERLDDLIGWYVSKYLEHLDNFTYLPRKDVTLGEFETCGKKYFVVHGDYDSFDKKGAADLVLAHGYKPAGIFFGHRHVSAMQDVSDIKLIQSGCLCGSVGDYCATKRMTGKPSQTVVICDTEGVECIYPVTLH